MRKEGNSVARLFFFCSGFRRLWFFVFAVREVRVECVGEFGKAICFCLQIVGGYLFLFCHSLDAAGAASDHVRKIGQVFGLFSGSVFVIPQAVCLTFQSV